MLNYTSITVDYTDITVPLNYYFLNSQPIALAKVANEAHWLQPVKYTLGITHVFSKNQEKSISIKMLVYIVPMEPVW